jgi:hypothetical protein
MRSGKIIKAFTLFLFIGLVTGFVAYRSGTFNSPVDQKHDNTERAVLSPARLRLADTPTVVPTMMSTSKSMILIDNKLVKRMPIDTNAAKKAKADSNATQPRVKKTSMMGSSKSGFIYEPEPDTVKAAPKK